MSKSVGLITIVLLSLGPTLPAHSQSQPGVRIDKVGTVHAPAFDVPLSSYMSEQAKQAFIKAASEASSDADLQRLSISQFRALHDSGLQNFVDRARALYPVNMEERRFGGVPAKVITPKGGVPLANRCRVLINVHGEDFSQAPEAGP